MTDTKYNKLVTRIFWFSLPMVIGLLTWLVIAITNLNTAVAVVKTEGDSRGTLQEDIYNMVGANYTILQSKADQKSNEIEHELIIKKIDFIEKQVNSILIKNDMVVLPILDTVKTTVVVVAQKVDTLYEDVKTLNEQLILSGIAPYKDMAIVDTQNIKNQ